MGQKHLTLTLREIIERLTRQGKGNREIARIIGYSPTTVSLEIRRNSIRTRIGRQYVASGAHEMALRRRVKASKRYRKRFPEEAEKFIRKKLKSYWSPEQISGRMALDFPGDLRMRISFKTIYRRLHKGSHYHKKPTEWTGYSRYLRFKRSGKKFRAKNHSRSGFKALPSIETRPEVVALKRRFGDWESDLIKGFKSSGYIASFVERSTGYLQASWCSDKRSTTYNKVALKKLGVLPEGYRKTLTLDRGKEFYGFEELEAKLGVSCYFCHPCSPGERGLNERINGLLRQFFPKKKSFSEITQTQINRAVDLINNRPRKKFGFRTTIEVMESQGLGLVLRLT